MAAHPDILEFQGQYRWLSNFWPCSITLDDMVFNSVEQAYVAAKTEDPGIRQIVQSLPTPAMCKKYGRRHIPVASDWHDRKLKVMELLLRQKFIGIYELTQKLDATGDCQIIEGNRWGDTFWGVCHGVGENHLGKLIMAIRAENRLYLDRSHRRTVWT